MDFDLDVQMPSLEELVSRHTLTSGEHEDVSEAGARQFQVGIAEAIKSSAKETGGSKSRTVNGITYKNRLQHFTGLENNMLIVKAGELDKGVAFDGIRAYYWKWVQDGHYVVDNRGKTKYIFRKKNGKVDKIRYRRYKYRVSTLNNGNRHFKGLNFVEDGVYNSSEDAVNDMKKKFISIIKSKGG